MRTSDSLCDKTLSDLNLSPAYSNPSSQHEDLKQAALILPCDQRTNGTRLSSDRPLGLVPISEPLDWGRGALGGRLRISASQAISIARSGPFGEWVTLGHRLQPPDNLLDHPLLVAGAGRPAEHFM